MTIEYIALGQGPVPGEFIPRRDARIVEQPDGGIYFDAPYDPKLTLFVAREFRAGVNWRARNWCSANLRWEFTASGRDVAERIIKHFYSDLPIIPPPPAHYPNATLYRVEGESRFIWRRGEMNSFHYHKFDKITNVYNRRYNSEERAWSLPLMFFDRFKRWIASDERLARQVIVATDAPAPTRDSILDAAYVEIYGYFSDRGDDRAHIDRLIVALHSEEDRFLADFFLSAMPEKYADAVHQAALEIEELGL